MTLPGSSQGLRKTYLLCNAFRDHFLFLFEIFFMCVNVLSFISPVRAIRGSDLFKEAIKTYLFKKAFACDT